MRKFLFFGKKLDKSDQQQEEDLAIESRVELDSRALFADPVPAEADIAASVMPESQSPSPIPVGSLDSQLDIESSNHCISKDDVVSQAVTYSDPGLIQDYFDVFKPEDVALDKIPTMFSHAIIVRSEEKNAGMLASLLIYAANHEAVWKDAALALQEVKVQRSLDQRGTIILAMLCDNSDVSHSIVDRFNSREDISIEIDKKDIQAFRRLKYMLYEEYRDNSPSSDPERCSHIAMVNLANSGDLRKIISYGGVASEDGVSPIPNEVASLKEYRVTAFSVELTPSESKLIDVVVNRYLQQNFGG